MFDYKTTRVQINTKSLYPIVVVNDEEYSIPDMEIPEYIPESLTQILWFPNVSVCYYDDTGRNPLDVTQENWDKWVQPFVDQWQVEKDKHDQEIEEANSFPVRQAKALVQLNADFETVKNRAHLKSSLGFTINANPTAKENVQGLIEEVGDSTVQFCDYYNQFHELNKSQLETLKSEINQNGQALYAQKWQYRTAIEGCTDNEGLDAVVAGIKFNYMDFTQTDDETVTE